jgi:hypothetical protein
VLQLQRILSHQLLRVLIRMPVPVVPPVPLPVPLLAASSTGPITTDVVVTSTTASLAAVCLSLAEISSFVQSKINNISASTSIYTPNKIESHMKWDTVNMIETS